MQEVIKPAKNRVMVGLKSHKNMLEQSHKEVETHGHLVGHQHMQTRQEERGPVDIPDRLGRMGTGLFILGPLQFRTIKSSRSLI